MKTLASLTLTDLIYGFGMTEAEAMEYLRDNAQCSGHESYDLPAFVEDAAYAGA